MRYPHQKLLLWLVVLCLTTALSSCHFNRGAAPAKESQADRLNNLFARSRIVLTSGKNDGEVHIPFVLRDGGIYIQMTWAGRPVEAMLDTGSASIEWPQYLHLAAIRTGIPQTSEMAAGTVGNGEWTVLSSIKAGGCEWQNIPAVASGEMKLASPKSRRTSLKTVAPPAPLLGATAFRKLILTIDYQQKEIIVRSPAYDISRLPLRSHDLLLTPEWRNNYLPVLQGFLSGRPARFCLDTGTGGMPINSRFAEHLPTALRTGTTSMNINGAQIRLPRLKPLLGTLAGMRFIDNDPPVLRIPTDVDALAGTGFLQNYRVTFDYARGKILLEPYSRGQQ